MKLRLTFRQIADMREGLISLRDAEFEIPALSLLRLAWNIGLLDSADYEYKIRRKAIFEMASAGSQSDSLLKRLGEEQRTLELLTFSILPPDPARHDHIVPMRLAWALSALRPLISTATQCETEIKHESAGEADGEQSESEPARARN